MGKRENGGSTATKENMRGTKKKKRIPGGTTVPERTEGLCPVFNSTSFPDRCTGYSVNLWALTWVVEFAIKSITHAQTALGSLFWSAVPYSYIFTSDSASLSCVVVILSCVERISESAQLSRLLGLTGRCSETLLTVLAIASLRNPHTVPSPFFSLWHTWGFVMWLALSSAPPVE